MTEREGQRRASEKKRFNLNLNHVDIYIYVECNHDVQRRDREGNVTRISKKKKKGEPTFF